MQVFRDVTYVEPEKDFWGFEFRRFSMDFGGIFPFLGFYDRHGFIVGGRVEPQIHPKITPIQAFD